MTLNYAQLENLFFDIQNIIDDFEQLQTDKKRFLMFLSNGDQLSYRITKESIAHLLGINTTYLQSTGIVNNTNSFEMLKELVSNPYRINSLQNDGIISYDSLFSPYIFDKVASFTNNIKINIFETEFVCKYDSKKAYLLGMENQKCDYIIVKKSTTNSYNVLYMVQNMDQLGNTYYSPMSNQMYDNLEDLKTSLSKVLTYQEITIINGIKFKNTNNDLPPKKTILPFELRANKINTLRTLYKNMFNCSVDVSSEAEFELLERQKHINNNFHDNNKINEIINNIKTGKIIKLAEYKGTDLYELAIACNALLCATSSNTNSFQEISTNYPAIIKELEELKKQLLEVTGENNILSSEIETIKEQNLILTSQNNEYNTTNQKILELLHPITKPSK